MKPFIITSLLNTLQLNKHWQRQFPFLKLRIYTPEDRVIWAGANNIPLHKMNQKVNGQKWLVIYPNITISTFEKIFQTTFGLKVKVLQKTGNAWIDTDDCKNQTLIRQNNKFKVCTSVHQMAS